MNRMRLALCALLLTLVFGLRAGESVVSVSAAHPRYFEDAHGKTWIPIGCNICFDRLYDGTTHGHDAVRANFNRWIASFAANGGNCIRLWAGHASLEVMPDAVGAYDAERAATLKGIVALCERLGIKVKITLESFRSVTFNPKAAPTVFTHRAYTGMARNFAEFYASPACRAAYLGKARHLKELGLGDSPAVYCWELWNEIDSCERPARYAPWSEWALAELKKMFPRQLTVNNLGSFSDGSAFERYDELAAEKGNDFLQIHRYLDAGAALDACRGPMDVVAASATRELLARRTNCPVIVAEIGAVQANHTGPFPYYGADREGTLLHDALFGAFFAGAAGCGQFWHWDHQYIDGNNLWWHYRRFAKAIGGLDPVAEGFKPFYTETRRLRMYGLRGKKTVVVWCRDKASSWESELVKGNPPETLSQERVPFVKGKVECYLPWTDCRIVTEGNVLPPFSRSIVLRFPASAETR